MARISPALSSEACRAASAEARFSGAPNKPGTWTTAGTPAPLGLPFFSRRPACRAPELCQEVGPTSPLQDPIHGTASETSSTDSSKHSYMHVVRYYGNISASFLLEFKTRKELRRVSLPALVHSLTTKYLISAVPGSQTMGKCSAIQMADGRNAYGQSKRGSYSTGAVQGAVQQHSR